METGKPGLASAPVHISSVLAQTEKRMDVQAPLTAVYIHTVPALSTQPYPQPPAVAREPAALHLAMPPLYSKETPTFLTLHIAGSLQSQPGFSLTAAAPAARPKSAGKHVCLHCGRDCMKPSVLEKHLRCHTGERPYPCTTCGVSFKTQSNLYKHKRTQAHARLSSESEQSSLGSQDSMSSSRETCTSSLSLDEQSEGSGSLEKDATFPAAEITCSASTYKVYSVKKQGPVSEKNELTPTGHKTEPNESAEITKEEEKQRMESEKPPLTVSRHLPLQRQQATLFSKQWESSVSRGKSQNHESTDSGFSESSDHYPSPGSIIPDHSMDSLAESTKEHLEEPSSTCAPSEPGQGGQEPKDTAREQEQKTLEERISKLISENTAVVEDKHLENVRPRKTVLSKQGSIDLPLPYTYKDSFHFDMRISKTPNVGLQRNRNPGLYSSVPTQHSSTVDHTPVTRSNSLPFSVTLLQPERSSPTSSYQNDYVTLIRRGSSGQINPTGFAIKPVNQQSSTHRPLVRQTAVDCNHATDALFMNSSVEEACAGSLSCDGDGGDICGEPSNRKFRRKKAQKFAYNKWHMYGGGTFKKLYNADKVGDNGAIKGRKSTNPEHEVVQSLQKRLSAVYKETVTTTSSTINVTSSSATVCHLGCPPAKQSGVDLNLKTGQLHSTCTSLKTPVRRNLSSPTLPLSSIGSVTHKKDGMSGTNAGRLINEEKHTDSTLQLCGAHIPSDRKKLRTDEKIICPVEMEINLNTMTHPPPSVTGCVPQQDTNLSYVNIQTNQKHSQLQGALFPPCIINANVPSVCTSLVTSTPPAAKTSFLPKYQLKLPNAAEPDSNDTLPAVDKPPGNDRCTLPSVLSSSHVEQTSSSVTTSENKCSEPVTSPSMQTCDKNKKTNGYSPLQGQIHLPERLRLDQNTTSNLAVVHRPFAGSTITTTCLQSYQAGLCSTSVQSLPVAPVVKNVAATPIITTEHNQSSAAPSPASGQLNSANRANAASNTPIVPCHIVPFNSVQPAGQNVFHVHTADLQICLQIISDEQLALIEPQIEQQAVSSVSPRHDMEAVASETIQTRAQKSVLMDDTDEQRDYEQPGHQKDSDQSESLPNLNTENIKPPLSVQVLEAQPDLHMTKHSDPTQATVSAESKPPEALGLPLHPHKQGHVNMVTETQSCIGDVMLTAASLKGVTTERSSEEHALPLNSCAEEQTHSGQNKLNMTSHFPNAINQTSMKNELLGKESRHKLKHLGGTPKAKGIDFACEIETCLPWASGNMCADELSGTVSIISTDKWKTPRQSNPQVSTCWRNPAESTLSETLVSSEHANMGYHRVGPSHHVAPSQEMTLSESQGGISSAHSEKQLGLFTSPSSNIQMEKPGDIQAVLTSIQSPTTAQKEPQTRGHGGTHGQPDWRPKQSQEAEETNHQCMEEQQGREVAVGENESREMSGITADEVPGQWETGKVESNCRYTVLPDMVIPEGEDRRVKADSSWLSEQHLQHLSRTPSGMSDYPPQSPQQAPNTLNNLNSSASSSQTSLFNPPQPPSEMINFYFSQLQHWDSRFSHNEETPNSSQCAAPDLLIETQTSLPQTETFSHQDQNPTLSAHQRNTTAGNNSAAECCCNKSTLGSHKSPSQDVKIPSSTHLSQVFHPVQVSKVTAGLTGDTQATKSNVLDNNTVQPSLTFMYTEPDNKADTKDRAPHDYTSQSSNSGRVDITSKYQSLFLAGQLHSCQPLDCLTSGVRPVQSCQDYTEDTSSSDDEGKLIIEL